MSPFYKVITDEIKMDIGRIFLMVLGDFKKINILNSNKIVIILLLKLILDCSSINFNKINKKLEIEKLIRLLIYVLDIF